MIAGNLMPKRLLLLPSYSLSRVTILTFRDYIYVNTALLIKFYSVAHCLFPSPICLNSTFCLIFCNTKTVCDLMFNR